MPEVVIQYLGREILQPTQRSKSLQRRTNFVFRGKDKWRIRRITFNLDCAIKLLPEDKVLIAC
ncbi:hypothetical protein LCGC14_1949550, partial [marine sediment metagenome]